MLRTMIETQEESTGKKQAIPPDLLAKVERADAILKEMLRKVGDAFDIEARWWFESKPSQDFAVLLRLSTAGQDTLYPFPKDDLRDDASIRRRLWTPIGFLIPYLDEQVDRQLELVRRGLEAVTIGTED